MAVMEPLMLELYQENKLVHVRPILPSINRSKIVFQVVVVPLMLEFLQENKFVNVKTILILIL